MGFQLQLIFSIITIRLLSIRLQSCNYCFIIKVKSKRETLLVSVELFVLVGAAAVGRV
jgi:hypothetical protein